MGTATSPAPHLIGTYLLTEHARRRLVERGISPRQVERVLEQPECVFSDPRNPGALRIQTKTMRVVINPQMRIVITVAWRTDNTDSL